MGTIWFPLTVRLEVLQFDSVRVCVRLLPEQTVLLDGDHEVAVQVGGQDLVPLTVRLAVLQLASVRVCVRLLPEQTVLLDGDHEVGRAGGRTRLGSGGAALFGAAIGAGGGSG